MHIYSPGEAGVMDITGNGRSWLSDGLSQELMNGPRMTERMQLSAALSTADRLLVSDRVCIAADTLMLQRPSTIPWKQLAFPPVTWMEYSPAARPALGGLITPAVSGVLLLRDPEDPDFLLVTGGWRGHVPGQNDEMGLWGAMARWSLKSLHELTTHTDAEIQEAVIGMASFWLLGKPTTEKDAAFSRWRLSVEATFAFSVLALLSTSSSRLEQLEDPRELHVDAESNAMDIVPATSFMARAARYANPLGGIWSPPLFMPVWTMPTSKHQDALPEDAPENTPEDTLQGTGAVGVA